MDDDEDAPPPSSSDGITAATPTVAYEVAREQWRLVLEGDSVPWARSFVLAKLANTRGLLLRALRRDLLPDEDVLHLRHAVSLIENASRGAEKATNTDSLRGHEGTAAKAWFGALPFLLSPEVRPDFAFVGRSRRPPRDPFNALLSFLYALLHHDVLSALHGAGLDPRLGFLHEPLRGRPALAFDLMEELRPGLADRFALALVNRRQLRPEHFQRDEATGGVRFTRDGLRVLFEARHRRAQEVVEHPLGAAGRTPLGRIPHLQALGLARALRAGKLELREPYTPDL